MAGRLRGRDDCGCISYLVGKRKTGHSKQDFRKVSSRFSVKNPAQSKGAWAGIRWRRQECLLSVSAIASCFILSETLLKVLAIFVPSLVAAVMMPIEISLAIRPYSSAVAPD